MKELFVIEDANDFRAKFVLIILDETKIKNPKSISHNTMSLAGVTLIRFEYVNYIYTTTQEKFDKLYKTCEKCRHEFINNECACNQEKGLDIL